MIKISNANDLLEHLDKLSFSEINELHKNLAGVKPGSKKIKEQYKYAEDIINKVK